MVFSEDGDLPVTLPKFRPNEGQQPEFLLTYHPNIPPKPFAQFPPHSTIMGFDFNNTKDFGPKGDVYIAEYGSLGTATMGRSEPYEGIGHRVSRIDMNTGAVSTFISNKSGFSAAANREGGFGRLMEVTFGPEGAMYILDTGIHNQYNINQNVPNTGVIWRVTKTK